MVKARARDTAALPAVDPRTGLDLPTAPTTDRAPSDRVPSGRGRGVRRPRRFVALLVVAAIVHVTLALAVVRRIDGLRSIDRIWSDAVSLDAARVALARDLDPYPAHVQRSMLEPVNGEVRARLVTLERTLRAEPVPGRFEALRDEVAAALQLHGDLLLRSPRAIPLDAAGNADERLTAERRRLLVPRSAPHHTELLTLRTARDRLARFVTEETGTVLHAKLRDGRAVYIDIDRNRVTASPPATGGTQDRVVPTFAAEVVNGRIELHRPSAERVDVVEGPPVAPDTIVIWSPDGEWLFYVDTSGTVQVVRPLRHVPAEPLRALTHDVVALL